MHGPDSTKGRCIKRGFSSDWEIKEGASKHPSTQATETRGCSDMTLVKVCVCVLVTALALTVCVARPLSDSKSERGAALAQRDPQREKTLAARNVRRDWMGSLTEDQRRFVSKYIPQILAELSNQEGYRSADSVHPIIDRDYAGWMDFGRRSTEEVEFAP
ncbi:gastrin/cholecystokinin-like peptide isoform X2 [Acipenser ruthenus]|uniref:gastrin/cholecystokinin-like peptide isoform X2 n=1 Tax=Acipenser ruthenus TaxID=7906 RepID=UPI0027403285|nr:gastrin/cholecystokinin-like peptide isoform X2 [Acipenser ruthenus]